MPEIDEEAERDEAAGDAPLADEAPSADPRRWNFDEGAEIIPGRHALKKLGGGYDYEAYLTWDEKLYSLVVAKCLRPHLVENSHAQRSMAREADHLLSLNHPVVVRGYDAVLDGERPHLLMEHLEGPNLASLIRRFGPLQMEQLLPLTLQICAAVHYLGTEEIVHLDIKPRNIIMGSPPRLIDLSVARTFTRAAKITGAVGTDAYMAPEQCNTSLATIGPPADIWGLGATLYHAASGRVPFPRPDYDKERDHDDPEVRWPQLHQSADPLPEGLPLPFVDVVAGCMDKDPDARPSVPEIVGAIEPLIVALPTKPVLRRVRPGRR